VDIDERFAELAQRLHRHRLAVHVRARASVCTDASPQDDGPVFVLEGLLGQPGTRGGIVGDREGGGDFGALGAVPHDFGPGAAARSEQQGIDENRLAGAGLAGEHRQP
jgi:hypothetical protein